MYPSNPNPPNASFVVLPEAPLVNELVVFDASQSTDEGLDCQLTCTFTWDFGDGSSGSGVTVTHRYTSPGGKVVRLTVADANGATTTLARTITVTAVAPPTVTVSPNPPIVTQSAAFTTVVAAGIVPTKYTWSWGDGSADTESTSGLATHTYAAVGSYTVTVTVEDSLGGTPTVGILSFTRDSGAGAVERTGWQKTARGTIPDAGAVTVPAFCFETPPCLFPIPQRSAAATSAFAPRSRLLGSTP